MKTALFVFALISTILLSACETSPLWYMTHPEKKTVQVGEVKISVIPRGGNHYDAFIDGLTRHSGDYKSIKDDHKTAVEMVTGCKVIDAEYAPTTTILQTTVNCPSR